MRLFFKLMLFCIFFYSNLGFQNTKAYSESIGFFYRSTPKSYTSQTIQLNNPILSGMLPDVVEHYRLLPGSFESGKIGYHFDGLASVLKFQIKDRAISYTVSRFMSQAARTFDQCIFFASGTGPTSGIRPCFENPVVNLLPIDNQLWLTIDTSSWGRIDPGNLSTIENSVKVDSLVLNAHPACDPVTKKCYVEHPCKKEILSDQACVSELVTSSGDMKTKEIARVSLPEKKMIQHSHSPCLTKDYMVIKLDSFEGHFSWNLNVGGVLKTTRQKEDNLWMVLDRKTNESFLSESDLSFVNNHFWNCYQSNDEIIVDSVASTHDYLFQYFKHNMDKVITDWENLFKSPQRCIVNTKEKKVQCSDLLNVKRYFDYPTYDPRLKTQGPPHYNEFYAISPQSTSSRWFDSVIKVDVASAQIVAEKNYPKYQFVSEVDFIPTPNQETGVLVTIVYDQMLDRSFVDFLDSKTLDTLESISLDFVIPFHAHGIICANGECYPNP